jgi:RHS repeat-associated protein
MKYVLYLLFFISFNLRAESPAPVRTPLKVSEVRDDSSPDQEPRKNSSEGSTKWAILNENGLAFLEQTETDQNGTVKIVKFDLRGLPLTGFVKNSWGTPLFKQQWDYDANGNKIKEITTVFSDSNPPRDYIQTWTYGLMNRVESQGESDGVSASKLTRYEYNELNQLIAMIKPDGVYIRYGYNPAGQLASMESSDGTISYRYRYDSRGVLCGAEDCVNNNITLRAFNGMYQVINETLASGLALSYVYDETGRKTKITLPDHSSIAYIYQDNYLNLETAVQDDKTLKDFDCVNSASSNAVSRLKEIQRFTSDGDLIYSHAYRQYNSHGHPTELGIIGEAGTIHYSYDDRHRISKIVSPFWSEEIPEDGYNTYGNICKLSVVDFEEAMPVLFSYTDEQQLSEEVGSESQSYTYDSLYNRLSKNGQHCMINGLNQLTQCGGVCYTYDRNGNRVEKKANGVVITYRYDALNRLISVEQTEHFIIKYTYDVFNRRVTKTRDAWDEATSSWKQSGSYRFLYDGDNEIGVVDEQGNIIEMRVLGFGLGADLGAAVAIERQGRVYAPIHDHRGSICCLVDMEEKQAVEYYRYTAFGEESIFDGQGRQLSASAIKNPWRFSSKRVDREEGLIHFGNRLYDPFMGRWTTPDPIGSSDQANLYTYAHNNPLSMIDPQGLYSMEAFFTEAGWYGLGLIYKLAKAASSLGVDLTAELDLSIETQKKLDDYATALFGEGMLKLFGYNLEQSSFDVIGQGEVSDKVRITLINGILTQEEGHLANANELSRLHGGANIHYVFHATAGWTWDMFNCIGAKIGVPTAYAKCLVAKWKALIEEMGGVGGGGRIIHYAHSLGAVDTSNALGLMTSEEAQMIDVVTLGSPKMIDDICCRSAQNYGAWRDGVTWFAMYGYLKCKLTGKGSYAFVGSIFGLPCIDHALFGYGYYPILLHLGTQFQQDYGKVEQEV